MGLVNKLLGQNQTGRSVNEYQELDLQQVEGDIEVEADMKVHIADLRGNEGLMDVKDLIYDGHLVIADISYFRNSETKAERVIEQLRDVTQEVGGDIVQKGQNQIIVAPRGVKISRDKIVR